MKKTRVFEIFTACVDAIKQGVLISQVSRTDKEFHFQNWFEERLHSAGVLFDKSGRNSYPDFTLVEFTEGYEIKGLAWPGRESTYDCNSQVPTGYHNGRDVFYVFGRYPKAEDAIKEYPVIDFVLCHGDFLNADHTYVHKNKSVKGFGSYGDIMIRDRKDVCRTDSFCHCRRSYRNSHVDSSAIMEGAEKVQEGRGDQAYRNGGSGGWLRV